MPVHILTLSPSIVFVGAHMEACAPFRRLIERGDNVLGLVALDAESMVKVAGAVDLTQLAEQAKISTLCVRNINQRSEEHTSELQSHLNLVCRLLLEKKKNVQTPSEAQDGV